MKSSIHLVATAAALVPAAWGMLWAQEPAQPVSGDCLALFTTKVQPILMNGCASCHATGRGGAFVLTRPNDGAARRATQSNLTAVIQQICFDQPAASPLLYKAGSPHGGAAQAALANRQAAPFLTLQAWVELLVAENRHLKAHGAVAVAAGPVPPVVQQVPAKTEGTEAVGATPRTDGSVPPLARTVERVACTPRTPETDASAYPTGRLVERVDCTTPTPGAGAPGMARPVPANEATAPPSVSPYDPTPFNQMAHPPR